VETTQVVLTAKASKKAIPFSSNGAPAVKLDAGTYVVYYSIKAADNATPDKVTLSLVPTDNTSSKVDVVNGAKQKLIDSTTVTVQSGFYKVQAQSAAWWVLVFDPKQ